MPWKQPTQITSWSFSRYNTYTQCPRKAKYLYIDKLKEPEDPTGPMARGGRIHELAANYVKGTVARLPSELSKFGVFFKTTRTAAKRDPTTVVVEETWAFRKDWTRTTYDDWNNCHLRVKVDLAVRDGDTVTVVDHKTGKFSPQYNLDQYMEQLDLYATAALQIYGDVKVAPELHFLDHGIVYPADETPDGKAVTPTYTQAQLPDLKKTWAAKTRAMLADKTFAPRPSRACTWCHFRKDNAGPCQF